MTLQDPNSSNLSMLQRGKTYTSSGLVKRLLNDYLRPHKATFLWAMFFMAIAASMRGAFAHMLQLITDALVGLTGFDHMVMLAGVVISIFLVRGLSVYAHSIFMNRVGQRIVASVQQEMCDHLIRSDLSFFHDNPSGTLVSRATNDVSVMRMAVNECMLNSFRGGLELAALIGVMFYQEWRLSVVVFIVFPVSALYVARMGKRIRRISSNTQSATGELSARLNQLFQGIRHVKAYGNERLENERVRGTTETIYKLSLKSVRVGALTGPPMEFLSALAVAALLLYGYKQIEAHAATVGDLMAFIMSFILAYDPMKRMGRVNAQFQAGLSAAERVFTLLDVEPSIVDKVGAVALAAENYAVTIDDVVFAYKDGTRALDHLTIKVPHGKTVAIVGASGAGKSTIINLIPRFYDVQQGKITVGDTDVRDVTMASLRQKIALVSQETALFDDTIRANIAYGKQEASESEIRQAAVSAFADAFIQELPQGYDTQVGEHGVKLSGGQRQRIAIARAMLRNAPVLLLDEATSALDNESERAVQAALRRLQEGRTTIVVAHRLSTIVDADMIVVLDRGRVAEQGTHAELLSRGGIYSRLYGMQSGVAA